MEKAFSFRKGYTFSFEEEGNAIDAWFSAFSGLEKVYLNGELVCCQRNLSTDSTNSFYIGAKEYSTNLNAVSVLKGPFVCTLSKNGKEYKRQKLVFLNSNSSLKDLHYISRMSFFIALGTSFGFAYSYWQLPKESMFVFLVILSVMVFAYHLKNQKRTTPVIEHEEIV